MIDHVWTVLCQRSVLDSRTNNVSLIDVVEQIRVGIPPEGRTQPTLIALNFEIVTLWSRHEADVPVRGRARLTVEGLAEPLPPMEYSVDLETHRRSRTFARIPGVAVNATTRIVTFQVELADATDALRVVARVPLEIIVDVQGTAEGPARR